MSRVALVTGGGTGIGAEVARMLVARGYRVAVNGRRAAPIEAVAAEVSGLAVVGDGGVPADAERIVAETVAAYGGLDCLVLNAGIARSGTILEQTPESWRQVMAANVDAAFLTARAAMPYLLERRGCVVAVASKAGITAGTASSAYCTSKAAMIMLVKSIAIDFGPQGVRANAVCPAWIRTSMADGSMDELAAERGWTREEAYAYANRLVPQRRAGSVVEAAATVVWLASDEAGYVNGVALPVDGGAAVVDVGMAWEDA